MPAEYELERHHLRLLRLACESWDRCQQAREILDRDGLTTQTESGGLKAHPAVGIERDARLAFARLLRELDLDTEAPPDRARPPGAALEPAIKEGTRHADKATQR